MKIKFKEHSQAAKYNRNNLGKEHYTSPLFNEDIFYPNHEEDDYQLL